MRALTSIPGIVLVLCVFLPAMRVCGHPTAPIAVPPCYAAYFGGIGVAIFALARRRALVKLGASVVLVLAMLCVGGVAALMCDGHVGSQVAICGITLACAVLTVHWVVRGAVSERVLAGIAIAQGLMSAGWAALLVSDPDAMWGAMVTLVAALALVGTALAWYRQAARPAPLPVATLL
jgi:hypothetical protein